MAEEVRDSLSPSEFGQAAMDKIRASSGEAPAEANGAPQEAVGQTAEIGGVLYDDLGNQVTTQPAVDERGRLHDPDTGRFLPREAEVFTPSPEPDIAPLQEERLYAGKYRSPEEMERAYLEQQSLQGRQSTEVGELRGQVQALTEFLAKRDATPQQWTPPPDPEENPEFAARWAVENENGDVYARAMAEWREIDRAAADVYEMGVAHEYELSQLRNEIEELKQFRGQQQQNMGMAGVIQRHGQIDHLMPAIGELARARPYIAAAAQAGDTRAMDDLITMARYQVENGQQNQQAELERRRAAAVVSAEVGQPAGAGQQERGVDIFRAKFRERMGLPPLQP